MKSIVQFIAIVILFALLALLYRQLFYGNPNTLSSPLINQPVPVFSLPTIEKPTLSLTQNDLRGKTSLLVFWATWCYACYQEHPTLMRISQQYHIPMFGIVYKDDREETMQWLKNNGNPFVKVGNDFKGEAAIDFGVYGTPETYLLNKEGKIIYRHVGALDEQVWQTTFLPLIEQNK
jgi:cytochrome c biogenesis protein CcmG/thiol:disulfide interchange protein DsbE